MEKVLKEKHFADVEKQKQQKHWKASESTSTKTVLSSGENVSIEVLRQMDSTLKATEV